MRRLRTPMQARHAPAAMSPRALACSLALAGPLPSTAGEMLQNWFDDPFFQVSSAVPGCPLPAGPFVSAADRLAQTHRRAEKGTTCWLAGECDRPNAYAYDRDIAAAFQAAARERGPFGQSTLWVTVQGRVIYLEGCAAEPSIAPAVEAFARSIPHVQQAIAIVRTDPSARPPYRLRNPD